MPITYSISEQASLIFVRAAGVVTTKEILGLLDSLISDPAVRPGMRMLSDGSEVTGVTPGVDLRQVANRFKTLQERGVNTNAIAAPGNLVFGVARAFSVYAEFVGIDVRVFRTVDEARAWLG